MRVIQILSGNITVSGCLPWLQTFSKILSCRTGTSVYLHLQEEYIMNTAKYETGKKFS
jgi:hypothetical protein